jgi:1-acyl-sn-glycerol-3-phosphate acyltransferase
VSELTYSAIIRIAKLGFRALGQQISITGLEHLPRTGGALVAVNHVSYVDFIYGGLPVERIGRRPRFMAKRELFDHRVTGPIMRACRHIEVDRSDGESSLGVALDNLRRGEVVGIFPEATISRAMEIKTLKTGAARIAAAAAVPLVPVVLWGTQRMMTKDHPRDLSRGLAITVRVGEPVPVEGDAVADTARLHTAMSGLLDTAIREYPQPEPGAWWLPARYGGTAPTLEEAARIDAEERAARAARKAEKSV